MTPEFGEQVLYGTLRGLPSKCMSKDRNSVSVFVSHWDWFRSGASLALKSSMVQVWFSSSSRSGPSLVQRVCATMVPFMLVQGAQSSDLPKRVLDLNQT